jgi:hypothetical protein
MMRGRLHIGMEARHNSMTVTSSTMTIFFFEIRETAPAAEARGRPAILSHPEKRISGFAGASKRRWTNKCSRLAQKRRPPGGLR